MTQTAAGPTTEAGRRLWDEMTNLGGYDPWERGHATRLILAIEQEAVAAFARELAEKFDEEWCERSKSGLLCERHDRALFPTLSLRCNGWAEQITALVRAALLDAGVPQEEDKGIVMRAHVVGRCWCGEDHDDE